MELEDLIKPLVVLGVCMLAVIIVFCANALPQLAASNEGKNKWIGFLVWGIMIAVFLLGVYALGHLFTLGRVK